MTVLDTVGKKSAVAQGLKKPVTYGSASCLLGQRVYLMVEDKRALGFIKVGSKRLFISPPALHASRSNNSCVQDAFKEINPVCVLDFYVHESCQRTGLGKLLFDTMLEQEGVSAAQLAYDRPSPKFLPFLAKHFGLSRYQPQNNNFVVFDAYFGRSSGAESRGARSHSVRRGGGGEDFADIAYGHGNGRGILPGGPAELTRQPSSFAQRPPLLPSPPAYGSATPSASTCGGRSEMEQFLGNPASNPSSRPGSLCSNSRPSLANAPPMQHKNPTSGIGSLQTPWGTAADMPALHGRHNSRVQASAFDGSIAGMPSHGTPAERPSYGRSASVPSRGHHRSASENPITGEPSRCHGSSGGSVASGSQRYASPLSHAGQRVLAL